MEITFRKPLTAFLHRITKRFNSDKTLEETILSVINQTYKKIEYIIIDGGSTDNSLEILRGYGSKIISIENANWGAPIARNFGLMRSTGELVAYLDADDYWLPTKISKQIDLMEKLNVDMVYCQMAVLDERGTITPLSTNQNLEISGLTF